MLYISCSVIRRFVSVIWLFLACSVLYGQDSPDQETIIIGYKNSPPFIFENENGHLEGISYWLWKHIASDNGYTFEFREMPLKDIIDGLSKGSIDISINPLTVTSSRNENMDFSFPFFASQSAILIIESTWLSKFRSFCGALFSINFLRAVGALIFIIVVFGALTWLAERKKNFQFESNWKGLWSGIWWSAVTMTTVGYGDKSPKTLAGRIIGLIWMFTALLIIASYTASLSSSLTVNKLSWNITDIKDLKEMRVGTVTASASQDFLVRNFFKNIKSFTTIEEGMDALIKHKLGAFIYDEPILRYLTNENEKYEKAEFSALKFNSQFYAFGFPKGHHLKEDINDELIRVTESMEWKIILNEYGLSNR